MNVLYGTIIYKNVNAFFSKLRFSNWYDILLEIYSTDFDKPKNVLFVIKITRQ